MATVKFTTANITLEVENGTTILDAARKAGLVIESPCNSVGTCGKCKVKVTAKNPNNLVTTDGNHRLTKEESKEGYVLACQCQIYGDIDVETKSTDKQNKTLKILSDGVSFEYSIDPYITKKFANGRTNVYAGDQLLGTEDGDTTGTLYGLSIDIGTTTLVTALIDLNTGEEITSVSALNPQSLYAQDVLTRIKFASEPDGLKTMYDAIITEIDRMITDVCENAGINSEFIYEAIYSGNTTMNHLAANINPVSLGRYPYTPVLRGGCHIPAKENGIHIAPFGLVYFPPIISAYVGADITSGVLSTRIYDKPGTTLLIDIGTNGEMVIAYEGALSATSTAAGPAFEGMNITFGMRAGKGAIEYFEINKNYEVEVRTIQNAKAVGICGSGLFDIVGELVRVGIITSNGKFIDPKNSELPESLKERLVQYEGKTAFEVAEGIVLTLKDIRQVQLAKGAVRAGVEALLLSQNLKVEDADRVLIAGSFGYHLRAKSLVNMELLPKQYENKIEFVGNTSKTGSNIFLLNKKYRIEMEELVKNIKCIELANIENFDKIFVGSLKF